MKDETCLGTVDLAVRIRLGVRITSFGCRYAF